MTTNVLNTKNSKAENKFPNHDKYITSFKTKHSEVQKKLNSLILKDHNFFLGINYFTGNDVSQNTFVYQPKLDRLEFEKDKGTDDVLSWKSKWVFNSKIKVLYTAFLQSIKLSECSIEIKFDGDPLAIERNNYLTKIVNVYIVYDLDDWARNPTNNFKFQICLFGATNVVKYSDKETYVYSGYGITFDSRSLGRFNIDTARNVIIFDVNNSLSSHSDNRQKNFPI